jgi:AcrR family transcriptional regulator
MAGEKTAVEGETRRERRIQRQREDIMDAAARLFANNGFAATTTKDIAAAADIGESTLYSYFPGKREILMAIVEQRAQLIDEMLATLTILDDPASYVNLLDTLMENLLERVDYTRALVIEAWVDRGVLEEFVIGRTNRITELIETTLVNKIQSGDVRPVDPHLTARTIMATFIAALLPVLRGIATPPTPEERRALSENIIGLILDGIAVHPSR